MAARSTARRAAGSTTGCTTDARHQGRPVDLPPPARPRGSCKRRRPRPDAVQLAGQRLPRSRASSTARRSKPRRRCRTPSASASASCTGCRPKRRPSGDRLGAPELRLRPDVMGTSDGLSKHPYIRESRRIRALKTIVEQEVSAHHQQGPRGAFRRLGRRRLVSDRHPPLGARRRRRSCRTRPFQIPLGALFPIRVDNLIAGGQEHRHDPHHQRLLPAASGRVEHRRGGGSAGGLRLDQGKSAATVHQHLELRSAFQRGLLGEGVPLAWTLDTGVGDKDFAPRQWQAMQDARRT